MQPEKVFKRYDVRGRYPEELDEEFMERMGKSLGLFVREKFREEVVVSRDNKDSSKSLKESLIKGLTSTGVNVLDAGVGPTDFAAFHGQRNNTVSAQITSSHMPLNFNGLKLMYPKGNGFVNEDLDRVKDIFREGEFEAGKGNVSEIESADGIYREEMIEFIRQFVQVENRKIVLETLGGAAEKFLSDILEEIGFEIINIAEEYEEHPYYDPPNPQPELLEHIPDRVEKEGANMALATDMDGDRLSVYYDGDWISGDDLFCIFAQIFDGDIVASIDSSENLDLFADSIHYTRVGDPFVIDKMIEENAVLSGEPNGHYCFPGFTNYNSGILAACLIAVTDLDPLLDKIPEKKIEKSNVETEDKLRTMDKTIKEAKQRYDIISDMDGVKFSYKDASVLVRPSGSSPAIRVKAEADGNESTREALEEAESLIRENI